MAQVLPKHLACQESETNSAPGVFLSWAREGNTLVHTTLNNTQLIVSDINQTISCGRLVNTSPIKGLVSLPGLGLVVTHDQQNRLSIGYIPSYTKDLNLVNNLIGSVNLNHFLEEEASHPILELVVKLGQDTVVVSKPSAILGQCVLFDNEGALPQIKYGVGRNSWSTACERIRLTKSFVSWLCCSTGLLLFYPFTIREWVIFVPTVPPSLIGFNCLGHAILCTSHEKPQEKQSESTKESNQFYSPYKNHKRVQERPKPIVNSTGDNDVPEKSIYVALWDLLESQLVFSCYVDTTMIDFTEAQLMGDQMESGFAFVFSSQQALSLWSCEISDGKLVISKSSCPRPANAEWVGFFHKTFVFQSSPNMWWTINAGAEFFVSHVTPKCRSVVHFWKDFMS